MKQFILLFALLLALFSTTDTYAVIAVNGPTSGVEANAPNKSYEELSKKEKRQFRKQLRKDLRKAVKQQRKSDTELLLLIIIAILLPPLAMAIYDGITTRFWLSLLLTLLFYVPGLIYTLYVILSEN